MLSDVKLVNSLSYNSERIARKINALGHEFEVGINFVRETVVIEK